MVLHRSQEIQRLNTQVQDLDNKARKATEDLQSSKAASDEAQQRLDESAAALRQAREHAESQKVAFEQRSAEAASRHAAAIKASASQHSAATAAAASQHDMAAKAATTRHAGTAKEAAKAARRDAAAMADKHVAEMEGLKAQAAQTLASATADFEHQLTESTQASGACQVGQFSSSASYALNIIPALQSLQWLP